jgi:uncharacterized protein (DUF2164 family)
MPIELTKQESADLVYSLQRFFRDELEVDLNDMRAKFVLDFIQKEIAPFAYNQGVKDSQTYLQGRIEDLPAMCFEEGLMYWRTGKR